MKNKLNFILNQNRNESAEEKIHKFINKKKRQQENVPPVIEPDEANGTENVSSEPNVEVGEIPVANAEPVTIADTQDSSVIHALQNLKNQLENAENTGNTNQNNNEFSVMLGFNPKTEIEEEEREESQENKHNRTSEVFSEETTTNKQEDTVSVQVEIRQDVQAEQKVEVTDSGVEIPVDSIPEITLNVNEITGKQQPSPKENNKSETSSSNKDNKTNVEEKKTQPKKIRARLVRNMPNASVPASNSQEAKDAQESLPNAVSSEAKVVEKKGTKTKANKKKENKKKSVISFLNDISNLDLTGFFKFASIVLFGFFILLIVFSVKEDEDINKNSKYIPPVVKDLTNNVKDLSTGVQINQKEISEYISSSLEEVSSIVQGMPKNYVNVKKQYDEAKATSETYLEFKNKPDSFVLDDVIMKTNDDQAAIMSWGIETNAENISLIQEKEEEIKTALGIIFEGKSISEIVKNDAGANMVYFAIQRFIPNSELEVKLLLLIF